MLNLILFHIIHDKAVMLAKDSPLPGPGAPQHYSVTVIIHTSNYKKKPNNLLFLHKHVFRARKKQKSKL